MFRHNHSYFFIGYGLVVIGLIFVNQGVFDQVIYASLSVQFCQFLSIPDQFECQFLELFTIRTLSDEQLEIFVYHLGTYKT